MLRCLGIVFFACFMLGLPLHAQDAVSDPQGPPRPAVLIADEMLISRDRELIARGNVEVFQGQIRLEAPEIRYDRVTGALDIVGPIRMQEGDDIIILADSAELDASLRAGLLVGARMVIDQQLQVAAATVERVDERYDQLYKTSVASCDVCDDGRPPLWQLRAKRVIHDKEERQLYFDQAQFLIRGVPVAYLPRLRLPDPSVERATGFLLPTYRSTSDLGFGIKTPYFIAIAPDRDITLTPYLSPDTTTLEVRYRQAFTNGYIQLDGAVSRDDIREGETRAYAFGFGGFNLRDDFILTFDIEATTDDAYLTEYDYSFKDRLDSAITISRARRDEFISAGVIGYKSLREGEKNSTLPTVVGDIFYERRFFPSTIGGEFRLSANAHSHIRSSGIDVVGRDVGRFNADAKWLQDWTLPGGLRAEATAGLALDFFNIGDDSTFDSRETDVLPFTTLALRYPLTKIETSGATQFLEPIAQMAWTGGSQPDVPNEESDRAEFDAGNLLSLSRFAAEDRRERDLVGAYGLSWSRFDPSGFDTSVTMGQVLREKSEDDFNESSGLRGARSDYLLAGQITSLGGLEITARSIFDNSFDFTKAELRGQFRNSRGRIEGTYIWLSEDLDEGRDDLVSEIVLDGVYKIDGNWEARADYRYDTAENRQTNAGIGLNYKNECVSVTLTVNRRNTSNSSFDPSTSIDLAIGLLGFSASNGSETIKRTCG